MEVRGLRRYLPGAKVAVLDGVDLDVAHGEILFVTGPSGSGTYTVLPSPLEDLIPNIFTPTPP